MSEFESSVQKKRPEIGFERVFGILCLLTLILLFINSDFFSIKKLEVKGERYVSATEIIMRSGLRPRQNIFLIDTGRATANLLNDPRIAAVTIARRLPDHVVLVIRERVPRCWMVYRNGFLIISDGGVPIDDAGAEPPAGLPLISGVQAGPVQFGRPLRDAKLEKGLLILKAVDAGLRKYLTELNLDSYRLYLNLPGHSDRVEVNLGDATQLAKKLFNLKAIINNVSTRGLVKIDLRIPDVPTVLTGSPEHARP